MKRFIYENGRWFKDNVRGSIISWANRPVDAPRRTAVCRPDSTRPWHVQSLDSTGGSDRFHNVWSIECSRTCLTCKGFTETNSNRRWYTGQQPGQKSGRRPADKPVINRGSTAGFVPQPIYIEFRLFVLSKNHSRQLFAIPCRARETVVSWAH